jgi:drug/metabolite transporter (DMT)-like permease
LIKLDAQSDTLKGLIYGFGAATCYGLMICAVKYLFLVSTITVFEILYLRSFIALIMVLGVLRINKISPFEIQKPYAIFLGIRCFTGFVGFALEFFSAKYTDLSKIVIILYNPFLTSLMSFLIIGETVTKHDILSFFISVTGIALLTDPFSNLKGLNDMIGISLALLSAVTFNIGFIALRHAKEHLKSW